MLMPCLGPKCGKPRLYELVETTFDGRLFQAWRCTSCGRMRWVNRKAKR